MGQEAKRQRECSSRCQRAKTPARRCRCACHGASHGSANMIPELSTTAESDDFQVGRTYAIVRGKLDHSERFGYFVEAASGQRAYLKAWLDEMLDRPVTFAYSKEDSGRQQLGLTYRPDGEEGTDD